MSYLGQCLCGVIQYKVDRFKRHPSHCHCSMCRKFHGSAFATFAVVDANDFHWLSGEDYLKGFTASNGTTRQFCQECGSSMTFASPDSIGEVVEISLGTLTTDLDESDFPNVHIYTGSKANWVELCDALTAHKEGQND